ncbi:uncharacterized protein LOC130095561 [Rhinichthys klamathensis goyatoka]|uniref:uncharacterized protein LOC130095561 n=1 Tax=Rhinichthys klamathensis goyatoka TaxID=3034132 RepID=UPI0024B56135|nr:uncharacterized protein LOC130095561 [Rhinichthys klamathensis goyatoka]
MIGRGFVSSNNQNPFKVLPSYHFWAPWIGHKTRSSNEVLNTEFEKIKTAKVSEESQVYDVTEDRLMEELMNQKVDVVRKLCKECGLDTVGSKLDLISRLHSEMQTRHSYDKIFQKIWGASGSQQTDSKTATNSKTGLNKQASLSLSHTHDGKATEPENQCGEHCQELILPVNLKPSRSCWTLGHHPLQEQLINYVLDQSKPGNELIVKNGVTCITRSDFQTLGLKKELESTVGNGCFRILREILQLQGKDVFIIDLYVPPTWLPPINQSPLSSFTVRNSFREIRL